MFKVFQLKSYKTFNTMSYRVDGIKDIEIKQIEVAQGRGLIKYLQSLHWQ